MELGPTIIQGPYNPDDCLNCLGDRPTPQMPLDPTSPPGMLPPASLAAALSTTKIAVVGGALTGALLLKNHRLLGALLGAFLGLQVGIRFSAAQIGAKP